MLNNHGRITAQAADPSRATDGGGEHSYRVSRTRANRERVLEQGEHGLTHGWTRPASSSTAYSSE
jgi:hypothetical protein